MQRAAVLLGCALWLALPCEPVRGDEPEHTTEKILTAWKKRREAVRTIDYVAMGEGRIPKGGMTDTANRLSSTPIAEFPVEDRFFAIRYRFASRFLDKKLRLESQRDQLRQLGTGPPIFYTDYHTRLFDGTDGFRHIPDEHFDASLGFPQVRPAGDEVRHFIESGHHPFLLAHGIVPVPARNVRIDDLAAALEVPYSVVASDSDKKGGDVVLHSERKGSPPPLFYELRVDPKRDYLITRSIKRRENQTLETTDLIYKEADDGWSLAEWIFVRWGTNGIERSHTMKVMSIKINEDLPDDLFVPPEANP